MSCPDEVGSAHLATTGRLSTATTPLTARARSVARRREAVVRRRPPRLDAAVRVSTSIFQRARLRVAGQRGVDRDGIPASSTLARASAVASHAAASVPGVGLDLGGRIAELPPCHFGALLGRGDSAVDLLADGAIVIRLAAGDQPSGQHRGGEVAYAAGGGVEGGHVGGREGVARGVHVGLPGMGAGVGSCAGAGRNGRNGGGGSGVERRAAGATRAGSSRASARAGRHSASRAPGGGGQHHRLQRLLAHPGQGPHVTIRASRPDGSGRPTDRAGSAGRQDRPDQADREFMRRPASGAADRAHHEAPTSAMTREDDEGDLGDAGRTGGDAAEAEQRGVRAMTKRRRRSAAWRAPGAEGDSGGVRGAGDAPGMEYFRNATGLRPSGRSRVAGVGLRGVRPVECADCVGRTSA